MFAPSMDAQFADELGELHDGSVSLFVTLPVFRELLVSERSTTTLTRFEEAIGEHLAHLDAILGEVPLRRDRPDGDLTRSLFRSLAAMRSRAPSIERDDEILGVLEQAQLFLMGSCGYALRYARLAGVEQSVRVLQQSMRRIGSLAVQFPSARRESREEFHAANAVA